MNTLAEVLSKMGLNNVDLENETPEQKRKRRKELADAKCRDFNKEEGDLNLKDGYNCTICNNKGGMISIQEAGDDFREIYKPCKCMKIRAMISKLEKSGLKNIIKDYTFDKYEATEAWQQKLKETALNFVKDKEHTWLYIGGMSGTGKTHLCTAVAAFYLRKNKAVKYMLWRDEITKIKSVVNDNEKYAELVEELKKAEVLYIDDLFKMGKDANGDVQRPTVADVNIAFEILNYRYNNKELVTIISSERTLNDLIDIDEALGGRISEMTVPFGYYIGIKVDPKKNYRTKGIIEL